MYLVYPYVRNPNNQMLFWGAVHLIPLEQQVCTSLDATRLLLLYYNTAVVVDMILIVGVTLIRPNPTSILHYTALSCCAYGGTYGGRLYCCTSRAASTGDSSKRDRISKSTATAKASADESVVCIVAAGAPQLRRWQSQLTVVV